MADQRKDILGFGFNITDESHVFEAPINTQLSMTNTKKQMVIVMQDPNGAGDKGFEGSFTIPEDYVGTPRFEVKYVLDGAPGSSVVGFGVQQGMVDEAATVDAAYEAEDVASNSTWTGYADEELVTEVITITPTATWAAGKAVDYKFFIDDSAHTYTGNVLIKHLNLLYADA